jgi:hypothetical protein
VVIDMSTRRLIASFIATVSLALAASPAARAPLAAEGGSSSAGGADDFRVSSAFFLGRASLSTPLTTCYEAADDFGIPAPELGVMVREAFEQWATYIEQKKLTLVPSSTRIRMRMELRAGCRGDENLKVYFGTEQEEVLRYRSQFTKPFGFAQLTQEYQTTTWPETEGKGFVWIAPTGWVDPVARIPSWSSATRRSLAALVLHEMGHVFGNGHVDGTVMTERIGNYLHADTAPGARIRYLDLYSQIDSVIELVPCMECRTKYSASETFDPITRPGQPASDWERSFKLLVGRDAVGPVLIRFEKTGSPQGRGQLTVMDSQASYLFDVVVQSEISQRQDSTPLFAGQGGTNFFSFGISYLGTIQTQYGKKIQVAVNYNMDRKKAVIIPLGEDQFYPRPIFVSAN